MTDEMGKETVKGLVSVVMPAWNAERWLGKCLESLMAQTYENWELVAVDDCSADGTWDMLRHAAATDPRVRAWRNTVNMGCGLARRRAVGLVRGERVAFVDADDYVDDDFMEVMLEAMERTGSEVAVCGTVNRGADYEYLGQDIAEREYVAAKDELYRQYMLSSWVKQYNGNKLYARRVVDAVEYSPLRYCEDSATTYRWLWEANRAVVLPRAMYHYVRHSDSNSNKGNEPLRKAADTVSCVLGHWRFCKEHGFGWMTERLRAFVLPYVVEAVRGLEPGCADWEAVDGARREMFGCGR